MKHMPLNGGTGFDNVDDVVVGVLAAIEVGVAVFPYGFLGGEEVGLAGFVLMSNLKPVSKR